MARSRGFSQVPRRRKTWEQGPGGQAVQTQISGSTALLLVSGAQAVVDGLTLMRLRGSLTLAVNTVSATLSGFSYAFGIGITTDEAFTTGGVTSVPDPDADSAWDGWIWWHSGALKAISGTLADGVNASALHERIPVDSKAMRKLRLGDVIFAVIKPLEASTATLNTHFDSRVLVALA